MKKITIKQRLIKLLSRGWYSNFQLDMYMKTSGASRAMRRIRSNPPEGYKIIQRKKKQPKGYNPCLEYKLVKDTEC